MSAERTIIMINGIPVGERAPCFIAFEAGPTHHGLESAKPPGGDAVSCGSTNRRRGRTP
jgi:hypothetical protein